MISINDINSAIINGSFSNDQLNSINMAVKFARGQLGKSTIRQLRLKDNVKFVSTRTGGTMLGVVQKIARKYITVNCGTGGVWRVPANMLETV